MTEPICYGTTLTDKCYWEKRFWQLFRMVDCETREQLCKLIGEEE